MRKRKTLAKKKTDTNRLKGKKTKNEKTLGKKENIRKN